MNIAVLAGLIQPLTVGLAGRAHWRFLVRHPCRNWQLWLTVQHTLDCPMREKWLWRGCGGVHVAFPG